MSGGTGEEDVRFTLKLDLSVPGITRAQHALELETESLRVPVPTFRQLLPWLNDHDNVPDERVGRHGRCPLQSWNGNGGSGGQVRNDQVETGLVRDGVARGEY